MTNATCSVTGCAKPTRTRDLCYAHYMKAWRYGTATPVHAKRWVDLVGQRFGALVVQRRTDDGKWVCICDCGSSTTVRPGDLNRGSAGSCGNRTIHQRLDEVSYGGAHDRVQADRGSASMHPCLDCGAPAHHWSYDHADPNELIGIFPSGKPVAYSVDVSHYEPRCVTCHRRFDLNHARSAPVFSR